MAPTQHREPRGDAPGAIGAGRWPSSPRRKRRPWPGLLAGVAAAGCVTLAGAPAGAADQSTVSITLTPQGCVPKPAKVQSGQIQFDVKNKDAGAVSEAELRTRDLAHILGEQENLTPGLDGGFGLVVQPGTYVISCPGAAHDRATFTVLGKGSAASWKTNPALRTAVASYGTYVNQNVASLVSTTQNMCSTIASGNLAQAEQLYPQARIFYERIEPVAEVWGTLDASIDARANDVAKPSDLEGFHKIEELMWANGTLSGAAPVCSHLVTNEQRLLTLVSKASYDPVTMATGATDLINEAATSKITGEEERYSNTDFVVFQANVDGAMEVVNLLKPTLQKHDTALVAQIQSRYQRIESTLAPYQTTPGYDGTGYTEYSAVLTTQRRAISTPVQAFAESLSKMSGQLG